MKFLKGLFKALWIILKHILVLTIYIILFCMKIIAENDINRPGGPKDLTSRQREYYTTGFDPALTNNDETSKPL